MSLKTLLALATQKENFQTLVGYIEFAEQYLDFVQEGLQAVIISQNENQYQFYQYGSEATYNITRPINSQLMYSAHDGSKIRQTFLDILAHIREIPKEDVDSRTILVRSIYTMQQSIGAALDALPAGRSNTARKLNGDLFENLIRLLIHHIGVTCIAGTIQIPIDVGDEIIQMKYQHDLLVYDSDEMLKLIGSVKTSSKDRIDKIFMDKFLYNQLTGTALPYVAIFLNDVQRKSSKKENHYGISSTFLPGHFKGFTIKLNPLDGVYYCDIRPNMRTETILRDHIKTIDHFFFDDLWDFIGET